MHQVIYRVGNVNHFILDEARDIHEFAIRAVLEMLVLVVLLVEGVKAVLQLSKEMINHVSLLAHDGPLSYVSTVAIFERFHVFRSKIELVRSFFGINGHGAGGVL